MASSSPATSDPNRSSIPIAELQSPDPSRVPTMNMDDLMKSFWPADPDLAAGTKSIEQVWREIGGVRQADGVAEMTLEDFLTKAGVVREEEFSGVGGLEGATATFSSSGAGSSGDEVFRKRFAIGEEGDGSARTSKKAAAAAAAVALEEPVDRAAQQRQRRMIKNRESAARSRERKMAYTQNLKDEVSKLEEENLQLSNEQEELRRKRYRQVPSIPLTKKVVQIIEYVIPVLEGRKPRRTLRRTCSMQW